MKEGECATLELSINQSSKLSHSWNNYLTYVDDENIIIAGSDHICIPTIDLVLFQRHHRRQGPADHQLS